MCLQETEKKVEKGVDKQVWNWYNNTCSRERSHSGRATRAHGSLKMKINGMMCGHCEARVKQTLEAIEGVKEAKVSHEKGSAVVSLEKEIAGEILAKAVTDAGYEVVEVKG